MGKKKTAVTTAATQGEDLKDVVRIKSHAEEWVGGQLGAVHSLLRDNFQTDLAAFLSDPTLSPSEARDAKEVVFDRRMNPRIVHIKEQIDGEAMAFANTEFLAHGANQDFVKTLFAVMANAALATAVQQIKANLFSQELDEFFLRQVRTQQFAKALVAARTNYSTNKDESKRHLLASELLVAWLSHQRELIENAGAIPVKWLAYSVWHIPSSICMRLWCACVLSPVVETLAAITMIVLAVSSIVEISARQSLLSHVEARMNDARIQIVASIDNEPKNDSSTSPVITRNAGDDERQALDKMKVVHERAANLVATGASQYSDSVQYLRAELAVRRTADMLPESGVQSSDVDLGSGDPWFGILQVYSFNPIYLSSDSLLLIVLTSSGGIGAIVAGLRGRRRLQLQPLLLGVLAGFISFLVIMGGRYVFLLELNGEVVSFNPYTGAFVGLISGLFTDRAHALLSKTVDAFATRVERIVNELSSNAVASAPATTDNDPASGSEPVDSAESDPDQSEDEDTQ